MIGGEALKLIKRVGYGGSKGLLVVVSKPATQFIHQLSCLWASAPDTKNKNMRAKYMLFILNRLKGIPDMVRDAR